MSKENKERDEGGGKPAAKLTREGSSQNDEGDEPSILERLIVIKEKLTTLLKLVPELEGNLEEENKSLRESLEYAHTANKDKKTKVDSLTFEENRTGFTAGISS